MKRITPALIVAIMLLASCAAKHHDLYLNDPVGFWRGLWHGFISPIAFVISLFNDSVEVWDVNNNGGWYTFGFLLGVGSLGSSSTKATSK